MSLSLFTVFAGMTVLTTTASATSGDESITVCHATNSDTNPYESNAPNMSSIKDANGIVTNGHGTHTGPVWTALLKKQKIDWGDIIPSFSYTYVDSSGATKTVSFEGLNWDAWGQEIWGNGCTPPAEQKSVTLTCVSVTPTLTIDLKNYSATPTVAITDNGNTVAGSSWTAGKDYYLQTTLSPNDVSHHVVVTMGGESIFDQTLGACFVAAPSIDIQKTPDTQSVVSGSTVTFTIDVTNTGNVPLTGVAVTDVLAPNCVSTIGSLAAGASIDAYTCTLANVTEGFTNTAGVSGMYGQTQVTDSDTAGVTVIAAAPSIDIQKTPDSQSVVSGSTVTFTIDVTNTGNVPLTGVAVTDVLAPNCASTIGSLAAGASIDAYTCTLANVTEGFTNTAGVSGMYGQTQVTDSDTADVTVTPIPAPAIEIQKTPDSQSVVSGSTVTFTISVTNTGNVPLTSVSVSDPLASDCVRADLGTLASGASITPYTCTVPSVTAGFTNIASATGTYAEQPYTDSDDAVVTVTPVPVAGIEIQKTPDTQSIASGGTATFSIVVTNTGTIPLSSVAVADPLTTGCVRADLGALAPGASTVAYTCTTGALTAGFTNVATATGAYGDGGSVTDSDSAAVTVTTTPPPPPPPPAPTPTPAVVVEPLPATVEEPVVVTPQPATIGQEPVVLAPQPATVILPQAAQAGGGGETSPIPAAGWLLLLGGTMGVLVSLRKLVVNR